MDSKLWVHSKLKLAISNLCNCLPQKNYTGGTEFIEVSLSNHDLARCFMKKVETRKIICDTPK